MKALKWMAAAIWFCGAVAAAASGIVEMVKSDKKEELMEEYRKNML